jgi:hypothetical protein
MDLRCSRFGPPAGWAARLSRSRERRVVCGTTRVRVEARYGDRSIGDLVSSEGVLYFDPDNDC